MQYINFGHSGLKVSPLCLGCMSFGFGGANDWTINEADSRVIIRQALEAGINFFDTANVYSGGESEKIVGKALRDFAQRDEVVLATKAYPAWRQAPNTSGLSRKALMKSIDDSLQRLGTDYVDLYIIHRWDEYTPIEETLEALNDIVKAGKALHIGASSMHAWQFSKALALSEKHGWSKFISMQNYVNLLYREEEREMLPLCSDQNIAVTPWSPLARGQLTRAWNATTNRSKNDPVVQALSQVMPECDQKIVEAVGKIAEQRNVPRAQIALAWLMSKQTITAPIIGASKKHHLDDAIGALDIRLTAEEMMALEAPYRPHAVTGIDVPQSLEVSLTLTS